MWVFIHVHVRVFCAYYHCFFFKGTVRFDKANELQGQIGRGCFIRTAEHRS